MATPRGLRHRVVCGYQLLSARSHEARNALSTHAAAPRPFWLAGAEATGTESFEVTSPYDNRVLAAVSVPTDAQIEQAVAAAHAAAKPTAALPAYVRAAALDHVVAPARRARRRDRGADHRGERQAAQVGQGRGRPGGVGVPLGGRGGPALRRRSSAARHRRRRRGPARRRPPLLARPGARASRRSTSR